MNDFNPTKLTSRYIPPATDFQPVQGRKYTLTHSDLTAELFLSVGFQYDLSMINQKMRDEVLAEWKTYSGQYQLIGKVYISGGEFDEQFSKVRFMIFQKEMSLALTAMMYGDQTFLMNYPWLLDAPIYIYFDSIYPQFNQVLYYGTPRYFLYLAFNQAI